MNFIDPKHPNGKDDNSSARVRGATGANRAAASGRLRADGADAWADAVGCATGCRRTGACADQYSKQ